MQNYKVRYEWMVQQTRHALRLLRRIEVNGKDKELEKLGQAVELLEQALNKAKTLRVNPRNGVAFWEEE